MSTIDPYPKQPEERIPGVYEGEYSAESAAASHDVVRLTSITGTSPALSSITGTSPALSSITGTSPALDDIAGVG